MSPSFLERTASPTAFATGAAGGDVEMSEIVKPDLPTLFRDSDTQNQRGGSGSFAPDPSESALQRRAAALVFVQAHALPADHPHASDFNVALLGPGGHGHKSYASICTSIARYFRRPLNDDVLRVANNAYHNCIASVRSELILHDLATPMVVRDEDAGTHWPGRRPTLDQGVVDPPASRHDTSGCQTVVVRPRTMPPRAHYGLAYCHGVSNYRGSGAIDPLRQETRTGRHGGLLRRNCK